jgi:hypothetical protein
MNELTVVDVPAKWDKLKAMVVNRVSSPITKRVYNMALNEFMSWFQQAAARFHQRHRERVAGIARRARARIILHHH